MKKAALIAAITLTPRVCTWLQQPTAVSLLHRFDQAINLVDTSGTIISVVLPDIGAGPFSLVVDGERPFPTTLNPESSVSKTATTLIIGSLHIDLRPAKLWQPRPNWEQLRQKTEWRAILPELQTAVAQNLPRLSSGSLAHFANQFHAAIQTLRTTLAQPDDARFKTAVAQLAGLGPGFTPAGDDFLLGMLLGLWATRPEEEVGALAREVGETAVPRTTQLSAAWLQAAVQGEAWLAWHNLLEALLSGDEWHHPFNHILNTGATSGIASLLGFIAAASAKNQAP